jgi:hypothetical protein
VSPNAHKLIPHSHAKIISKVTLMASVEKSLRHSLSHPLTTYLGTRCSTPKPKGAPHSPLTRVAGIDISGLPKILHCYPKKKGGPTNE